MDQRQLGLLLGAAALLGLDRPVHCIEGSVRFAERLVVACRIRRFLFGHALVMAVALDRIKRNCSRDEEHDDERGRQPRLHVVHTVIGPHPA